MITNYYSLRALVHEWQGVLTGARLGDAYSQARDELTLAFTAPDQDRMVRIGTRRPLQFIYDAEGTSRARRNVATLFEQALERTVEALRIAERDRMLFLTLSEGMELRIALFGPKANVYLVSAGRVVAAFRDGARLVGSMAPEPRPAPSPETLDAFEARWRHDQKTVAHAVSAACPLFDRTLGREAAVRGGIDPDRTPDLEAAARGALFQAVVDLRGALSNPEPRIYWDGEDPALFSLIHLRHVRDLEEERFDTAAAAARIYVRRSLARRRFRELFDPVKDALEQAAGHYRAAAERMLDELARESRADRYERWGHLLMARAGDVPEGAADVQLEDLFADGAIVTVPLDPSLSAIQNAERYYDRARRARRAREEAVNRLVGIEELAEEAEGLLEALRPVRGLKEMRSFRNERADDLVRFMQEEAIANDRIPFRRYALERGYEVWVGRNARQNDELTFRRAQKYDLWMHARGAAGSHAVLRLPNRSAEPDRRIIEQAAAVAAYHSKARGSALVPVMVTQRKYVRKPRGAPPGAVAVEHEEVVLVEPRLPK
jgi:predicted ribosome quality control (RQC) complex YloA/Tae2 family protein